MDKKKEMYLQLISTSIRTLIISHTMKENISESIADNFSLPVSDTKYSELITLVDFLTWHREKKRNR